MQPYDLREQHLRHQRGEFAIFRRQKEKSIRREFGRQQHETVAELPPSAVIIKIAKALQVSTDDLLGLKPPRPAPKTKEDPEMRRLWRKFQQVQALPEKDRRAVIRLINSLVIAKKAS